MPVDQSGESILFWIDSQGDQPHTEAHIQIQYEGDPERFAWIVPVMEVPEVRVSSQAMFDNLLAATVPTISLATQFVDCFDADFSGCGLSVMADEIDFAGGSSDGGTGGGEDEPGDGPEILDRGQAGAFEYVTLTGDSVEEIVDWLELAGYAQDPDAPPILEEYLEEDFVFVAFKLRADFGTSEIHPLAIRYPGIEPCIPIRLTRIAATEDMAIRAFFLGQRRVVPQNWPHVELNWAKLDWLGDLAAGYRELVATAVDEAEGGRAFVTEYAGTDAVVSTTNVHSAAWDPSIYAELEPFQVVATLDGQGLLECELGFGCDFRHPQVRPLLERYLPAPEGVDPETYWSSVDDYLEQIDYEAWTQAPGFAADFEERISGPGAHAIDMLEDASYLTRLFTLLSPHEMLEDPLFHESDSLGNVDNLISATRVIECGEAPDYFELPDARSVAVDALGSYPEFPDMPAAERVERVPSVGPAQIEVDNAETIEVAVSAHNEDQLVGPGPSGCATARRRSQSMLAMFALFGLAWLQRAPRRRRES